MYFGLPVVAVAGVFGVIDGVFFDDHTHTTATRLRENLFSFVVDGDTS